MKIDFDCIIVGSGVAGMTAAIYLKRANVNVLIIERDTPGGQIVKTSIIENYPGFTKISGADLALNIYNQVLSLNIDYKYDDVIDIQDKGDYKTVRTAKEELTCKNVIIATGRLAKTLNIDNERKLIGKGLSYCATCDGAFYKDKVVGIIGSGNSALEEALFLSEMCKHVYIFNRSSMMRGENILQERIGKASNIEVLPNCVIKILNEKDNHLVGITTTDDRVIGLDGLFVYIGQKPSISFIKDINLQYDNEYIIVNKNMETDVKGIYAIGDVIKKDFYQIATAVGEGTIAALNVKKNI